MSRQNVFQSKRWLVLAVALVGIGAFRAGASIPITNPGFEADAVNDISVGGQFRSNVSGDPSTFQNPLATGWTLLYPSIPTYDDRLAVIQDLYGPTFSPPGYLIRNPDGSLSTNADDNNILGLGRSNQVSQALSAVFGPTVDYTLTVRAARLIPQPVFAGGRLILGYGTASSFTTLAAVTNVDNTALLDTLPDAAPGDWVTIQLNYSTGSSGPEVGQNIVVAFAPTYTYSGVASYVDDFVLVPEPSAVAMAGSGLILLWRRRSQ